MWQHFNKIRELLNSPDPINSHPNAINVFRRSGSIALSAEEMQNFLQREIDFYGANRLEDKDDKNA